MSKELFDGQERFDGMPVTVYDGRFSGSFDVPDAVGAGLEYDDIVSFIVTCHVGKATIDATKLGDLKRTNTFAVQNVTPVSAEQANELYNQQGIAVVGVNAGQLTGQLAMPDAAVEEEFLADEEEVDEEEIFSPGSSLPSSTYAPPPFEAPQVVAQDFVDSLPERTDKVLENFLSEA